MNPKSTLRFTAVTIAAFSLVVLHVGTARAGDFYVTGNLAISSSTADSSGQTDFFELSGSATDAAPVYGGAIGYGFRINEPIDSIFEVPVPSWELRGDISGEGGRDFQYRTDGGDGFFTEIEAWNVMYNTSLDIPLHEAISWVFGRVPILQPLSIYTSAGIGVAGIDAKTTDNFSTGSDDPFQFAWQAGTGVNYAFTNRVSLSLGYRYFDMGDIDFDLVTGPDTEPFGAMNVALESHEFTASLRVNFWSLGIPSWVR